MCKFVTGMDHGTVKADGCGYRRTYSFGGTTEGEDIREGFEPGVVPADTPEFVIEEDEPDGEAGLVTPPAGSSGYGALDEEGNPWGSPGTHR